jgi:NAD(P)-dependent dehydrogenase (short-subunit alcohol dehydrogenase family)
MKIKGSVAFVTGANRGIGLAFATALLERGAKKVYAGVRNPNGDDRSGLIPSSMCVTPQ